MVKMGAWKRWIWMEVSDQELAGNETDESE